MAPLAAEGDLGPEFPEGREGDFYRDADLEVTLARVTREDLSTLESRDLPRGFPCGAVAHYLRERRGRTVRKRGKVGEVQPGGGQDRLLIRRAAIAECPVDVVGNQAEAGRIITGVRSNVKRPRADADDVLEG